VRKIALPFLCGLALGGPFCFAAVADTDTGWHVALGRLILQGTFPHTNALSWKWGDHPWYPTSWLFDVLCAIAGTALGLQVLTFLFFALTLLAISFACESAWVVPGLSLLLVSRLVPRPHLASWALLAAVLALAPRSTRARAFCVGLVAIAGNLHSGAVFGAFVLGLESLEAFRRSRQRAEILIAVGAGLALLFNPGLLFNARYLIGNLFHLNDVIYIKEMAPPLPLAAPAFYVLLPLTLLIAVHRRRERPALLVAAVVFALLGLRAQYLVCEAEIAWAPTLAWGLARMAGRLPLPTAGIAAALLCALSVRLDRIAGTLRFSPSWDASNLPVRAARFLDEHAIDGPGFNAFRDGGYLAMARPRVPVFIDGRVQAVPDEGWRALQQVEGEPASAFQAYLERIGCEWAIASRGRQQLGGYRRLNGPRWALVYWDDISEVFVRRDVARFAGVRDSLEYRYFRPYGSIVGAVEKLDRNGLLGLLSEIDRFELTSPGDPFALLDRCAALTRLQAGERAAVCDLAQARAPQSIVALVTKARQVQALR
jgi:hypothetical protein